jgi:hypothetical protein
MAALLIGRHMITVEVRGALLELGEVLDERSERLEPCICWLNRPRRLTVSMRNRRSSGRVSGFR